MNIKQKTILHKLVGKSGQKYSELYKYFSYEDKFPYHLKYLITNGLIKKRSNRYFITKDGMKVTANFDTRTLEEVRTPILAFLFICQCKDKYLLGEHFADDPERKIFSLQFAKIPWNQNLEKSSNREFFRKYHIEAKFRYRSTYHIIDHTSDGDVLFDNVWLVFETQINDANCDDLYKGKNDHWLTKEQICDLPNFHPVIKRLIINNDRSNFIEESIVLDYGLKREDF